MLTVNGKGDSQPIPVPVREVSRAMPDSLRWWLIASVSVLLASLALFVANVVAGFAYFTAQSSPLWITVVGVVAVLGMGLGFGGLFLVLIFAGVRARKNEKAQALTAE